MEFEAVIYHLESAKQILAQGFIGLDQEGREDIDKLRNSIQECLNDLETIYKDRKSD